MKINIDGREYSFKFYHENPPQPTQRGLKLISTKVPVTLLERATTCIVFNEEGTEVSRGTANVHPKDNFDKEKGRQISLTRAIDKWDKPYKTQVWAVYRNWGKARW